MKAVMEARARLEDITPLKRDCGRYCGAACCSAPEGEVAGMLLFPGEEALYEGLDGWEIRDAALGKLIICGGTCERSARPLSCRMFPLLPVPRADGSVAVRTDLRARAVCPLARQGKSAVDPAFAEAVRAAGETLIREAEQAAFLRQMAAEQEELRQLRNMLGGG